MTGTGFVDKRVANAQLAPTKQTLRWNNMAAARYAQRAPPLFLAVSQFAPQLLAASLPLPTFFVAWLGVRWVRELRPMTFPSPMAECAF